MKIPNRRQRRHDQLRQVLPEERLQLLNAFNHADGDITSALAIKVRRSQSDHLIKQPLSQRELHL